MGDDDGPTVSSDGLVLGLCDGLALGDADGLTLGLDVGSSVEQVPSTFALAAEHPPEAPVHTLVPTQSSVEQQPFVGAHFGHSVPPQSMSVSSPFQRPSEQPWLLQQDKKVPLFEGQQSDPLVSPALLHAGCMAQSANNVGELLGEALGEVDGAGDGEDDGNVEGDKVGANVGSLAAVGSFVGNVGKDVGDEEGAPLGLVEGESDGDALGTAVGTSVLSQHEKNVPVAAGQQRPSAYPAVTHRGCSRQSAPEVGDVEGDADGDALG